MTAKRIQSPIRIYKLRSNPTPSCAPIPPLDLLEPLIDKVSGKEGGHWLWDGEFDDINAATFVWRQGRKGYRYFVARVLYQHFVAKPTNRTGFVNLCGAFSCVNPEHWHSRTKEEDRWAKADRLIIDQGESATNTFPED